MAFSGQLSSWQGPWECNWSHMALVWPRPREDEELGLQVLGPEVSADFKCLALTQA